MHQRADVVVTGLGVQCALGNTVDAFTRGLREGAVGITYEPPGDETLPASCGVSGRIAATPARALEALAEAGAVDERLRDRLRHPLRRAPRGKAFSLLAAAEAVSSAGLGPRGAGGPASWDPGGFGLVVAGGGPTHRLIHEMGGRYRESPALVRPGYATELWDSDLVGAAGELFGTHGESLTTGGASAAGNVGLVTAFRLLRDGYADACLVLAPMAELTFVELTALRHVGALGGKSATAESLAGRPASFSRPFDAAHDGFVPGEGAAALLLETAAGAAARGAVPLAGVRGGAVVLHGERGTAPSVDAEVRVMRRALDQAGLAPGAIDYVNAHATSTPLGDEAEAAALTELLGEHATRPWVNATKALTGHCLGSASAIEAVACVQQLRHGFAHPNPHLREPVQGALKLNLVPPGAVTAELRYAINNGFGFGGINSCVVLERATAPGDGRDDGDDHGDRASS
ncbi:malonyl-ACP decarboxylase [Streptomyces zhaozhouensis]|uniref:Malonyl-ACP decarboxylase n=1 Tax=Streptomyces zhaozhouensis TaxID=1300267 RepID=A0A286E026_9ACTN|nr:beta-ketoacyl synthase N-terminal-like domain-containing protein [Streptomyces zhaozhouensis]SOD64271.1 malonyl-ACP decarboxylase [Streptomyces zhaozhouensis]